MQLRGEGAVRERLSASGREDHRMEFRFGPLGGEVRHEGRVPPEYVADLLRVDPGTRKAIDLIGRGTGPAHCAHQQLVLDQALEHSLSPAKQLMTRMHPQRGVDVEQQRLELLRVQ